MSLYHERKAQGLCPRCAKPLDHDGTYCVACTEYNREKSKASLARKKQREGVTRPKATTPAPTEARFSDQVLRMLAHTGATVRSTEKKPPINGWPDLEVSYLGRIVAVELKRPGCDPERHQLTIHAHLRRLGVTVLIWRTIDDVNDWLNAVRKDMT